MRTLWLKSLTLFAIVFLLVLPANAVCNPNDTGTAANDTIDCTAVNTPTGNVEGQDGDDTITVDAGVTAPIDVTGGNIFGGAEAGDDTITNNGTVGNNVFGDSYTSTGSGDDVITNNGTVSGSVFGDSWQSDGSGDDVIVNNGTVNVSIHGDSYDVNGTGDDTIINNGTVASVIEGDTRFGTGSGNDTIINNGTTVYIVGDSNLGSSSGSDTITNNNTVSGDIYGDDFSGTGTGDDAITNNGTTTNVNAGNGSNIVTNTNTVNGSVITGSGSDTVNNSGGVGDGIYTGDGSDTVSNSGGTGGVNTANGDDAVVNSGSVSGDLIVGDGTDTVTIQGDNAVVNGTIDGGTGTDTLTFEFTFTDPDELDALAAEIAAANPNGGTLTFRGQTYVWTNFEELRSLLTLIGAPRLNAIADPVAVFCAAAGGLDIYAITPDGQGAFALWVSAGVVRGGLDRAEAAQAPVMMGENPDLGVVLYALPRGELQVNQGTFDFTFRYELTCGPLPIEAEMSIAVQEIEADAFVIINRPR